MGERVDVYNEDLICTGNSNLSDNLFFREFVVGYRDIEKAR